MANAKRHYFYNSKEYRAKLSHKSFVAWQRGSYDHLVSDYNLVKCKKPDCSNQFSVKPNNPKKFCSLSCATSWNNSNTRFISSSTRFKIARSLIGRPSIRKGLEVVPRIYLKCLRCSASFKTERWKNRKYCSNKCAIKHIGSSPTNPRASRGKYGVRVDISKKTIFFSRWEANFARLLDHLNIKWKFEPKTFDIGGHKYTPDFYLPEYDLYVEIKNYLSEHSLLRDKRFRKKYPKLRLLLILRENYVKLQEDFSRYIPNWEFN